jgi:probable phosphoglycerate mutase
MRHGETLFNQLHLIQGSCDSPLTERGKKQAQIARRYFTQNNIEFDKCVCSTQERASDTLELIIPDCDYMRLKGIKEWDFGKFEAQPEFLNPAVPYGDFFAYAEGETIDAVGQRMLSTLTKMMSEFEGENLLAVSHGGAMACFARATGDKMPMSIHNCGILKFSFTDEKSQFRLLDAINHDFSELEDLQ